MAGVGVANVKSGNIKWKLKQENKDDIDDFHAEGINKKQFCNTKFNKIKQGFNPITKIFLNAIYKSIYRSKTSTCQNNNFTNNIY